ncbi:ECF transporter S component [Collinsella sp. AGMB00827]|uniref:Riboflavin transporter n=1 Tax=Collinsella ureilytica TaxID=2869515 RepID=A0ABS7MIQ2_9ACTN|nr:ECF transporter S component [Collinsella urealyticum]MBY4797244.1 ECF transporter S component [Collinsella urealyticum]
MATRISPQRIALAGLLTAGSLLASFIQIPIFPAAPWLCYDPSGVICLIAALVFGPGLGVAVAIISWIPRMFLDPFGVIMGILNTCAFIVPAAIIYEKSRKSRAGSIAGMVVGAVAAIVLSCAANLIITPLYTPVPVETVVQMIIPILLPFNALKMLINVVAGQVLLAPCMSVLSAHTHA